MPQPGPSCSAPGGPSMIVKLNPVGNGPTGLLQGFEAMRVHSLLFQRTNEPFHRAILLRTMRRDEFLPQAVAANQSRVIAARKDQTVTASQQERFRYPAQGAKTGDRACSEAFDAAVALPRATGASPAIHACGRRSPAPAWPTATTGPRRNTGQSTNADSAQSPPTAWSGYAAAGRWPACEPAANELEYALHGVLVEAQQIRHCPVAKRRRLLDH